MRTMSEARERGARATRLVLAAIVFAGLGAFVYARFAVTADITHFLPDAEDRHQQGIIFQSPIRR